jgi:hypothetical protein
MNISTLTPKTNPQPVHGNHQVPHVNNYRMGVQDTFLGQVEYPIDSHVEQRAYSTFHSVKNQQNQLAWHEKSLDNTFQDSDPRPGVVLHRRQGYDSAGQYVEERIDFSYSTLTGAPLHLSGQGRLHTGTGSISMQKDVSWDSHGQVYYEDKREHRDSFGIPTGSESVRGFEYTAAPGQPSGLEYSQKRRGWLLP